MKYTEQSNETDEFSLIHRGPGSESQSMWTQTRVLNINRFFIDHRWISLSRIYLQCLIESDKTQTFYSEDLCRYISAASVMINKSDLFFIDLFDRKRKT